MVHDRLDAVDQIAEVYRLDVARALAAEAAHPVDHVARTVHLGEDARHLGGDGVRIELRGGKNEFEILHGERNRVERLTELMGDARRHLAERRHLGRLRHLRLFFAQQQCLTQKQGEPVGEIEIGGSKAIAP